MRICIEISTPYDSKIIEDRLKRLANIDAEIKKVEQLIDYAEDLDLNPKIFRTLSDAKTSLLNWKKGELKELLANATIEKIQVEAEKEK